MFFRRNRRVDNSEELFNSDKRIVVVCLGGPMHQSRIELLFSENGIGFSTVSEYYQMDLTKYNTAITSRSDAVTYFEKNRHCYGGLNIYLVNPKGLPSPNKCRLSNNIRFIDDDEELILRIVKGVVG